MQRLRLLRLCAFVAWLLMLQAPEDTCAQQAANSIPKKSAAVRPAYFLMDLNGSYKYAFDTDSGISSQQSANQENEVTGQYSYLENGVPYMVKYKAGVQGYQAQIIPGDTAASLPNRNSFKVQPKTSAAAAAAPPSSRPVFGQMQRQPVRQVFPSLGSGGTSTTLKFVQNAMQMMRTQPIQVSFMQHGPTVTASIGGGAIENRATTRYVPQNNININNNNAAHAVTVPAAPVSKAEVQQINSLASKAGFQVSTSTVASITQTGGEQIRQPYTFSYASEQSARSESADKSGNVVGKYSYYDEAGFHELTYKAGDETGFVVLGGNLVDRKTGLPQQQLSDRRTSDLSSESSDNLPFLVVSVSQRPQVDYKYRVVSSPPVNSARNAAIHNRNRDTAASAANSYDRTGRSLRKFRRHANW